MPSFCLTYTVAACCRMDDGQGEHQDDHQPRGTKLFAVFDRKVTISLSPANKTKYLFMIWWARDTWTERHKDWETHRLKDTQNERQKDWETFKSDLILTILSFGLQKRFSSQNWTELNQESIYVSQKCTSCLWPIVARSCLCATGISGWPSEWPTGLPCQDDHQDNQVRMTVSGWTRQDDCIRMTVSPRQFKSRHSSTILQLHSKHLNDKTYQYNDISPFPKTGFWTQIWCFS